MTDAPEQSRETLTPSPFGTSQTDESQYRAFSGTPASSTHDDDVISAQPSQTIALLIADRNERDRILQLRGEEAQLYLDELQSYLDNSPLMVPMPSSFGAAQREHQRAVFHLLRKLCAASQRLPRKLYIQDVQNRSSMPVDGGAYGDIYEGIFCGSKVAMKKTRTFWNHSEDERQRHMRVFCREVIICYHLRHPSILPFIGVHVEPNAGPWNEDVLFGLSPWMENSTLSGYIKRHQPTPDELEKLIGEVASSIAFLHSEDVVHGDIRGGNILVSADGRPLLCDLGLTGFADEPNEDVGATTKDLMNTGTVQWMAPELFQLLEGDPDLRQTKATDVYAFACTVWEMHAGCKPFPDVSHHPGSSLVIMRRVKDGERPSRPTVHNYAGRAIDDALWDTVQQCWAQDPEQRSAMRDVVRKHWPELRVDEG